MIKRILGSTLKRIGILLVVNAILFEIIWGIVIATILANYDNDFEILHTLLSGCSYSIIYGSLTWITLGLVYLFGCE